MRHAFALTVLLAGLAVGVPAAVLPVDQDVPVERAATLVDIVRPGARDVRREAFRLTTPQVLHIEATGAESGSWGRFSWVRTMFASEEPERPWQGNAWVLDLQSRRVVWELRTASTRRGSDGTRMFEGTLRLQPGTYAAYYAAFPDGYFSDDDDRTSGWSRLWQRSSDAFGVRIEGNGTRLAAAELDRAEAAAGAGTTVALTAIRPGRLEQAGFEVTRTTDIELTATGELAEDAEFDHAWIIDANTRKLIWRMTWETSEPAGGASKNRVDRRTIPLARGRYAVFYGTDDSHDPTGWNAAPPYDPAAWGVVIRATEADTIAGFKYEHVPASATIAAITRVGDGESRREGFTLTRPMDVRIYALGEGRDNGMFDYAWITASDSRRRVWQMRYEDTDAAGGDPKNRLLDTVLRLDKGSYVVHYVSDGSHSYREWNASAPSDGEHWGVTVLAATGSLDKAAVAPHEPRADPSLIAEAVQVRDEDRVQRRFSLDSETLIRIVALGEGSDDSMYDHGWIEDVRTGRRAWEMTYRTTEHAGGASKNRRFEGTIKLPAGEYALVFETDGSHAFGEWNADPPDDPEGWGISVYRER
jgi:hypothetical protein